MTVQDVCAQARREVQEHLAEVARYGPDYLDNYVEDLLKNRRSRPPVGPLHPAAAKLIRDVALDVVSAATRATIRA